MTKLLENIYRAVNIALVNELKMLCLTAWVSISGKSSRPPRPSPSASRPFIRARAWAGTASPSIPFYLTWKAREYDFTTRFIELAGEINTAMPYFVVQRVTRALNEHREPLNGAKILVLGVAYKKDEDDNRETQTILSSWTCSAEARMRLPAGPRISPVQRDAALPPFRPRCPRRWSKPTKKTDSGAPGDRFPGP